MLSSKIESKGAERDRERERESEREIRLLPSSFRLVYYRKKSLLQPRKERDKLYRARLVEESEVLFQTRVLVQQARLHQALIDLSVSDTLEFSRRSFYVSLCLYYISGRKGAFAMNICRRGPTTVTNLIIRKSRLLGLV